MRSPRAVMESPLAAKSTASEALQAAQDKAQPLPAVRWRPVGKQTGAPPAEAPVPPPQPHPQKRPASRARQPKTKHRECIGWKHQDCVFSTVTSGAQVQVRYALRCFCCNVDELPKRVHTAWGRAQALGRLSQSPAIPFQATYQNG